MTAIRWILWIGIGGIAVWLFERFFGGTSEPVGLLTPDQFQDPGSQVGTRGTGTATRDAFEASWRTAFQNLDEQPSINTWFSSWRRSTPGGLPGTAGNGESTTTLDPYVYITLGDSCSLSDGIGYTEPVTLPSGGTSQTIAHCYRQSGRYQWVRVGEINT